MRSFFKNLIFTVIIVFCFFLILETVVRVKYYRETKDATYLVYGHTDFEFLLKSIFDKFGSSEIRKGNGSSGYTIAVFGGSTVYGWFVPRDFAWPELLKKILTKEIGNGKINVLNYGQGGSDSSHDVDRMASFLAANTPDLIILYTGVNDNANFLATRIKGQYRLKGEIDASFIQRLDAKLMKTSLFYTVLKEKYNSVVAKDIDRAYRQKGNAGKNTFEYIQLENKAMGIYAENLKRAIRLSRTMGVKIAFGTIPEKEVDTYYLKFVTVMKEIAEEFEVPLIDVFGEFEKMGSEGKTKLFVVGDNVHLNKSGTKKVAVTVSQYLIQNRII